MKTRLIVVLLGFLGSGMFVACRDDASDKDDDRPGKAVELAFQAKYPGATGCRQNMRSLIPRFLLR